MPDNRGHSARNVRSWWPVQKYDTGASAWVSDAAIPAPGIDEVVENRVGTAQMIVLADGSLGRVVPDNTFNFDQIRFLFHQSTTSSNLLSQLQTYQQDHTGVRITTHTSEIYEGYIEAVNRVWHFQHEDNPENTIEVLFQPFDVDGSGTIND